jgi:hypothetical protein
MTTMKQARVDYPSYVEIALEMSLKEWGKKYIYWIAKNLDLGYMRGDIMGSVEWFHRNKDKLEKKDIYVWELKELEEEIKRIGESRREKKGEASEDGSVEIWSKEYKIIRIDSREAMGVYGRGSRWCITQKSGHYFEQYMMDGSIFYVLIDGAKKWCIQKNIYTLRLDIWSVSDLQLNIADFLRENQKYREGLSAVLSDYEEPKLLQILLGKYPLKEALDWLGGQSEDVKKYIKKVCPIYSIDISDMKSTILGFININTATVLANILKSHEGLLDKILEVTSKKMKPPQYPDNHNNNNKEWQEKYKKYSNEMDYNNAIVHLRTLLRKEECLKLMSIDQIDKMVSKTIAMKMKMEKDKNVAFGEIKNKESSYVKNAIQILEIDDLIQLYKDKSVPECNRKQIKEKITGGINTNKVINWVLKQDNDKIKEFYG